MPVNLSNPRVVHAVAGVRIGTACAEIKQAKRDDLALFVFDSGTHIAGVYTKSHFKAAPVIVAKENEQSSLSWLVNSGNANAATGNRGETDARETCQLVGESLGLSSSSVQPFSTGVIGEFLPMSRLAGAISEASTKLDSGGWERAATAIMTTDTRSKIVSSQTNIAGQLITITGIAKGSGMIKPDMATMLAFIASDISIERTLLKKLLAEICDKSFNRITVDGDTSTNDCFMLACTGAADMPMISSEADRRYEQVKSVFLEQARILAQSIVRDGEGATKFISVLVQGGVDEEECLAVAYSIAESPLVKTALFAGDPNWGRFCMAIGKAPVDNIDTSLVELWLDDVLVAKEGMLSSSYSEDQGVKVLAQDEFLVKVCLGRGDSSAEIWTTDLSYEYVKINAEYRT